MALLSDINVHGRPVEGHRPWPRVVVTAEGWRHAANELAAGRITLLGLWGDAGASYSVHMALMAPSTNDIAVVSLECVDQTFPSVGALHPRAGHAAVARSRLLGCQHPLGARRPAPDTRRVYEFLPVEGENLHQIPVGPVHAGIIEPGHFRFTAGGERWCGSNSASATSTKASNRSWATIERASQLAARTSGDSTVAYGIAFARAVEAALNVEAPPRAHYLRALMAELERLANHLGDIGAICNDASFALMHAHCGISREYVLRAAEAAFGHRLMMDQVKPGGAVNDLKSDGASRLRDAVRHIKQRFPHLIELYDNTASLLDRTVTTGIVRPEPARQFGAPGHVGRASGRNFDARKSPGYPPYDTLEFTVPVLTAGDVDARVWVRIREVEQSLGLIEQILDRMPEGPIASRLSNTATGEGLGLAEGFRGDVLIWVRIDGGRIARCHLRDPSWFQWPLLEAAIEGNIVAGFPLCNKSFNCSYSGHDL
jgi:Ni,Fe-hydrogenase III large subunit